MIMNQMMIYDAEIVGCEKDYSRTMPSLLDYIDTKVHTMVFAGFSVIIIFVDRNGSLRF